VVEIGGAVVEHSGGVEGPVGGVHGDGQGLDLELSGHEGAEGKGGGVATDLPGPTVHLTGLILGRVLIGSIRDDTLLLHVLEGLVHVPSLTSQVTQVGRTIN